MAQPKSCGGPLVTVGCEFGSLDPQAITWPSRSPQQLCWVGQYKSLWSSSYSTEPSSVLKPVIQPCVAVVRMCSSLQPLELASWFTKPSSVTLFSAPHFSHGHSSSFSQLYLVSEACRAAGLKNQKIFTVEDGSGFSHQLPWLKQVPAALGEKLLAIKLLPVRRASWKLSVFNILMKSAIKILTTRLVAFQWHVLHLSPLLMACKSDQRLQNAAETHISGFFTPQNEERKEGGRKDKTPSVCCWVNSFRQLLGCHFPSGGECPQGDLFRRKLLRYNYPAPAMPVYFLV